MATIYALVIFLCYSTRKLCSALDTITPSQFLQDPQFLVSKNGTFKLGIFTPRNSTNRHVGIRFNKPAVMNVVWVANQDKPITDSSTLLKISEDGNLQLLNGQKERIWSSQVMNLTDKNTTAQLLDSGNLVLQQVNSSDGRAKSQIVWQSFDHPTNTLLLDMKPTFPRTPNKENVILQSWRSLADPSDGSFTLGIGTKGVPQVFVWQNGTQHWRSGPSDGNDFIGMGNVDNSLADGFVFEDNLESGIYMSFSPVDRSLLINYVLESQGVFRQQYWDDVNKIWTTTWSAPTTEGDVYATCGTFGTCNIAKSSICTCLQGFEPKNQEWRKRNWWCVRRTPLQCGTQGGQEDGFLKLELMKVPFSSWMYDMEQRPDRHKEIFHRWIRSLCMSCTFGTR